MVFTRLDFSGVFKGESVDIGISDSRIRLPWWATGIRWSIASEEMVVEPLKVGYNNFVFVTSEGATRRQVEVWRQELLQALLSNRISRYDCSMLTVSAFLLILLLWTVRLCSALWVVICLVLFLSIRMVPELFLRPHWILRPEYPRSRKWLGIAFVVCALLVMFQDVAMPRISLTWDVPREESEPYEIPDAPRTMTAEPYMEVETRRIPPVIDIPGAEDAVDAPCASVDPSTCPSGAHAVRQQTEAPEEDDEVRQIRERIAAEVLKRQQAAEDAERIKRRRQLEKEEELKRIQEEAEEAEELERLEQERVAQELLDEEERIRNERAKQRNPYQENPVEGNPFLIVIIFLVLGCMIKKGWLFETAEDPGRFADE